MAAKTSLWSCRLFATCVAVATTTNPRVVATQNMIFFHRILTGNSITKIESSKSDLLTDIDGIILSTSANSSQCGYLRSGYGHAYQIQDSRD